MRSNGFQIHRVYLKNDNKLHPFYNSMLKIDVQFYVAVLKEFPNSSVLTLIFIRFVELNIRQM
jgi:hypothetical protein